MTKNLIRPFVLSILALATCGLMAAPASAEVKQVEFVFDDGRINIGQFKGERLIDPAVPERIGSLIGAIETDTGDFSAPQNGLYVPSHAFESVSTPMGTADVVIQLSAVGPVNGNLDPVTGDLDTHSLLMSGVLSVYQSGQPENEATLLAACRVSPVALPLDSEGVLVDDHDPLNPVSYEGADFGPRGAAVATWDSLPASTPVGGTFASLVCPYVDQMAAGPGGVWLAGLADITEAPAGPGVGTRTDAENKKAAAKKKKCKRLRSKSARAKCRKKARKRS